MLKWLQQIKLILATKPEPQHTQIQDCQDNYARDSTLALLTVLKKSTPDLGLMCMHSYVPHGGHPAGLHVDRPALHRINSLLLKHLPLTSEVS